MLKIIGLDRLQKELENARRAFQALDGQIATLHFNPNDEQSVASAIHTMETAIDEKAAPYRGNQLVGSVIPQMKAKYRAAILERANRS